VPTVYLNGDFIPLQEACISPLDRGFTFGDGVYEVVPVYSRRIFRLHEHIRRLDNSLGIIHIQNPLSPAEWEAVLERLVDSNEGEDQSIYLQVTRGVSARDHAFSQQIVPTVFIMSKPLEEPDNSKGAAAIVHEDIRWRWCHIKAITLLPSVLLRYEAGKAGAREAILIHEDKLTEGAASNVFVCSDGRILTPPKSEKLLPGITRDLVIELLHRSNMHCEEVEISEADLREADEIWITSSTQEIVPITRLDDQPVGPGVPGPLWKQAVAIFREFKAAFRIGRTETD